MARLSFSRSARSSSSACLPSIARSDVCASWLVASRNLATWITDFAGSTTRKYTTALTLTETLSSVITSCGGTSRTMVRRSTRTICCTTGMRSIRPGPLTLQNLPSMNTTARSYSRMTRNDARITKPMMRMITPNPSPKTMFCLLGFVDRYHGEQQIVAVGDADALASPERHAAANPPLFAAYPGIRLGAVVEHLSDAADQFLAAGDDRSPARLEGHTGDEEDEQAGQCCK